MRGTRNLHIDRPELEKNPSYDKSTQLSSKEILIEDLGYFALSVKNGV